jgi:hypothetical protein
LRLPVRVVALLVAGALGGLLAPGRALAATTPQVVFSGGTPDGLLGCAVTVTPAALRVPVESMVLVVNKLNQQAELLVNDVDYGAVPAGHQVGVTLHRGPIRLSLVPGCQLSGHAVASTVEVTGGAPAAAPSVTASASGVPDDSGDVEVSAARPVHRPHHVSGLLVLVAGVLIVGVSIMAIRGKIAERPANIQGDKALHARREVAQ